MEESMKLGLFLAVLALPLLISGCCNMPTAGCLERPPIVMQSNFQRKVITPCDNDLFCFRNSYDVTWDSGSSCINYPVSYKSKEYVVETSGYGYAITLPAGGSIKVD